MATYSVDVNFLFSTTVELDAPDSATAEAMVMGASRDQIAHLNGKSYADASEAVRSVTNVTKVV